MVRRKDGRPSKKKWLKVFQKEIRAAGSGTELWGTSKIRITIDVPWLYERERQKDKLK